MALLPSAVVGWLLASLCVARLCAYAYALAMLVVRNQLHNNSARATSAAVAVAAAAAAVRLASFAAAAADMIHFGGQSDGRRPSLFSLAAAKPQLAAASCALARRASTPSHSKAAAAAACGRSFIHVGRRCGIECFGSLLIWRRLHYKQYQKCISAFLAGRRMEEESAGANNARRGSSRRVGHVAHTHTHTGAAHALSFPAQQPSFSACVPTRLPPILARRPMNQRRQSACRAALIRTQNNLCAALREEVSQCKTNFCLSPHFFWIVRV